MRLVTIQSAVLKDYLQDKEMLRKANRPCALIVKLKYQGRRIDFAVPIRSNITPNAPKWQYFPLPPRHTTKDKFHHGIHYIKMFPIDRKDTHPFRTEGNVGATLMKAIIDKNEKIIISACQQYLINYEAGKRPKYATDLDLLLSIFDKTRQSH